MYEGWLFLYATLAGTIRMLLFRALGLIEVQRYLLGGFGKRLSDVVSAGLDGLHVA